MKLHSIPLLVIAQLLFLVAPAMACKHTPPEWQQRVQKHALAAMIGQQKHLTWSRDRNRNFIDDEIEARFHAGEPFAKRIEQKHSANPREIDNDETETIAMRRICEPINRRLKQPMDGLVEDRVQHDSNRVRCHPLQNVEEQRHAPKCDEEISNP